MATKKASGGSKGRKTVSKATKKVTKARKAPGRKAAKAAGAAEKGAGTKQAAVRKTARKPAGKAAKKSVRKPAKKAVARKPVRKPAKKAAKKTVRKPAKKAAKKTVRKQAKKAKTGAGGITPAQALANTRKLLREKQAHDRQTPPWQAIEAGPGHGGQAGYQSAEAAQRAEELHAGESRMPAIQGSIGTRQRHNQGKRDSR